MIRKSELTEHICEVAGSHGHEVVVGVGNIYQNLSKVSASWLESIDNMHKMAIGQNGLTVQGFLRETDELLRISAALSRGDEEKAVTSFLRYIEKFENGQMSFLMQKYIAADFLGEISKIAKEKNINLSNQSISLIMSAQSIEGLKEASCEMMHLFCVSVKQKAVDTEKNESQKIYEYINLHFAEYDMSIEKVAEAFCTNTAMVRQSVVEHTGKMYKDYIISLRVEYAKTLLLKEGMTVADTCRQVGYGNISYFIKLFKGVTGVTPAKFKETEESDYE